MNMHDYLRIAALAAALGGLGQAQNVGAEQYGYDDLGRLTSATLDDCTIINYRYDPAGNRQSVTTEYGLPGNEPPLAVTDSSNIREDQVTVIRPLTNDTDPDGDTLVLESIWTSPDHGIAVINGNDVTYTPDPNYYGTDSFEYEMNDGQPCNTDIGTVNISIASDNDAPVAVNDGISTDEDEDLVFDPRPNDSDVETAWTALRIDSVTNGSRGTVSIENGAQRLRYSPNLNQNGTDTFTYTVRDTGSPALTATATVTVMIAAVNDPIQASDISTTTPEDVSITINPVYTDPDGPGMTITNKTNGSKGTVVLVNGATRMRYNPYPNVNGPDSFTYTVSDGLESSTATVSISIAPVNDAPTANLDTASVNRNGSVTINVLANDQDPDVGDTKTVKAITSAPIAGIVNIVNGGNAIRYVNVGNVASDFFHYEMEDSAGAKSIARVDVTINGGGIGDPD